MKDEQFRVPVDQHDHTVDVQCFERLKLWGDLLGSAPPTGQMYHDRGDGLGSSVVPQAVLRAVHPASVLQNGPGVRVVVRLKRPHNIALVNVVVPRRSSVMHRRIWRGGQLSLSSLLLSPLPPRRGILERPPVIDYTVDLEYGAAMTCLVWAERCGTVLHFGVR